eukprot:m.286362 g.286362  ORF g.286362 m.286362 type:complete len:65 (+) comp16350_c0_seq14:732-926(+)
MPEDPNNPGGYIRRNNYQAITKFNSARMEVLMPTMMTVGKLAGIGLAVYFGGKLSYKAYKRYRN